MDVFKNKGNNKILKIEDEGLSYIILVNFVRYELVLVCLRNFVNNYLKL